MSNEPRQLKRPLAALAAFALVTGLGANAVLGSPHRSGAMQHAAHAEPSDDPIDTAAVPAYLAAARVLSPGAGQVARQAALTQALREAVGGIWASGGDSFVDGLGTTELDVEMIFDN